MIVRSERIRLLGLCVAGLAMALARPAAAQTADDLRAAVLPHSPAALAVLAPGRLAVPSATDDGATSTDMPKTAVDHRFASSGLMGSVGYLCGIDSFSHDAMPLRGPAISYGRESTFLGAKLSYAFK